MPKSAGGRWRSWTSTGWSMPELDGQVKLFLDELRRQNASEHTVRNYASDLDRHAEMCRRALEKLDEYRFVYA